MIVQFLFITQGIHYYYELWFERWTGLWSVA